MGQSSSRVHHPSPTNVSSPTTTTRSPQPRERRRSMVPKGVRKLKRTLTRPSTWYGNKSSKAGSSEPMETGRISMGTHSDTTASSTPSTPMISTPSPRASPVPDTMSSSGAAKPPVVELTPTNVNEARIEGIPTAEGRPGDVLPASCSLSRRASNLDSHSNNNNNDMTIPPETNSINHLLPSSSSSSPVSRTPLSPPPTITTTPSPLPTQLPPPATEHVPDTLPPPSTTSPINPTNPNPSSIRTPSNPHTNPAAPRQFPPPGTLVLVQGVVQTTDVPRPSNVPATAADNVTSAAASSQQTTSSAPSPSSTVTRPRANSESSSVPSNRPSTPITPRPLSTIPATSPVEISTPTLENSAVGPANDTSATPIESHESGSTTSAPTQQPPGHQMSPNSVEVLGTLLSVAAAATAASLLAGSTENILSPPRPDTHGSRSTDGGDFSLAARRERMRHAWQSVRERLGLRPSAPPVVPGDSQPVDAREIMLAEMARAFNLGLGIGPDGSEDHGATGVASGSTQAQPTSVPVSAHTPSPQLNAGEPGSFERFLNDLQYDLRGVLNEERPSSSSASVESPALPQDNQGASSEAVLAESAGAATTSSESSAHQTHNAEGSSTAQEVTAANDQDSRSRNVNWWRMYRFPPINAQSTSSTPASASSAPSPTTPTATTEVNPVRSPIPSDAPHTPPIPSNVVHPIVVVGLRSVNTSANHHAPMGGLPIPPAHENHHRTPDFGHGHRTADPLRNLRSGGGSGSNGRRSEEREEANGAPRTFLIFVIGGYYPPDHSMVTGGENGLASFEALLELAEMLGQAKPQTASRDDIERSGLEIIKAADLPRYEAEKRISSNCTERCLICLDDYVDEDPIRVLKCRHGFHKTCVDRWLETGKNNCPACRSAGVNTGSSPIS